MTKNKMPNKKPKRNCIWITVALCLIVALAIAISNRKNPEQPASLYHYNEATAVTDAAPKKCDHYMKLTPGELADLLPDRQDLSFTGTAEYNDEGFLQDVVLQVDAPFLEGTKVSFSDDAPLRRYEIAGEPVSSRLNGHDFDLYQWSPDGKTFYYDAFGEINGCYMQISYVSSQAQSMADFEEIVDCFTAYREGKPDLSVIKDVFPNTVETTMSFSEAQKDPEFGAYLPDAIPEGFAEESIRHYRDPDLNFLSGVFTSGTDALRWHIRYYTGQDADRLTGIDELENYDLSLYLQSVPDALRQIVNDPIFLAQELTPDAVYARAYKSEDLDNDGRITFGVKYGDILVSVSAKGVEPQWIYEQLTGIAAAQSVPMLG